MNFYLLSFILTGLLFAKNQWKRNDFSAFESIQNAKGGKNWKAKHQNGLDLDNPDNLQKLAGSKINPNDPLLQEFVLEKGNNNNNSHRLLQTAPLTSFDLRNAFPLCKSLKFIRDQGGCGSCWVVSSLSSLSDNYCMKFSTSTMVAERSFSYEDVLECCPLSLCTSANGCDGGNPISAFSYVKTYGACTGDAFGDFTKCKPYFLDPNANLLVSPVQPVCQNSCANTATYTNSYLLDKFKIRANGYMINFSTLNMVTAMQNKISTGVAVVAFMDVYWDFFSYSSGVYVPTTTDYAGGHAVKIIGWGVSNTQKYWIVANSWGTGWGIDGYFWIALGSNVCRIEYLVMYGTF